MESIAHIAVVYEGMGDYRKAIAQYEKAAEATDNSNLRRGYLGRAARAAYYLGDQKEMLRLATQAKAWQFSRSERDTAGTAVLEYRVRLRKSVPGPALAGELRSRLGARATGVETR